MRRAVSISALAELLVSKARSAVVQHAGGLSKKDVLRYLFSAINIGTIRAQQKCKHLQYKTKSRIKVVGECIRSCE